jgi:hypothetical protein
VKPAIFFNRPILRVLRAVRGLPAFFAVPKNGKDAKKAKGQKLAHVRARGGRENRRMNDRAGRLPAEERTMTNERHARIIEAYNAALGERDASDVAIEELLPAVFAAVPDATIFEIRQALIADGERLMRKADALEAEYRRRQEFGLPANDNAPF